MSICIHCGQDHDASVRICPQPSNGAGTADEAGRRTLFGVAPAVSLPPPRPPGTSASASVPLGKTAFAGAASPVARERSRPRMSDDSGKAPSPPPLPSLPSEEEARQNPDLIIKLDRASKSSSAGPENHATAETGQAFAVDLPPAPNRDKTAGDLSPPPSPSATRRNARPEEAPRRFALPQPYDGTTAEARKQPPALSDRLVADTRSILELLNWAFTAYLRQPKPLLLLAALLIFPASLLESCLVAGITGGETDEVHVAGTTTVDFTARKAELASRIQNSQTRGQFDKQAATELAALTAVEAAPAPGAVVVHRGEGWLREKLANLIQGLLLFGLAFPIAYGALSIAAIDRLGGASLPSLGDLWPILVARSELFLLSLIPAALLVAVGNALFILPGLVLSVLFLFVPQVVLFEKKSGRAALRRSIDLVKSDAIRVVLAFLSFALAGFASVTLTELFIPPVGGRAMVFIHFVIGDLLAVAVLPIPAMVLARIYLDLRGRKGLTPEQLSRAARS